MAPLVHKRLSSRNNDSNEQNIFNYFSKAYASLFNEYFDIGLVLFAYFLIPFIYLMR